MSISTRQESRDKLYSKLTKLKLLGINEVEVNYCGIPSTLSHSEIIQYFKTFAEIENNTKIYCSEDIRTYFRVYNTSPIPDTRAIIETLEYFNRYGNIKTVQLKHIQTEKTIFSIPEGVEVLDYLSSITESIECIIEELIIPETVVFIANLFSFKHISDNLTRIIFKGTQDIDLTDNICARLDSLAYVELPKNLTRIPKFCFEYANLKSIQLPNRLLEIGECAFKGNPLTSIDLPNSLTYIGKGAFEGVQIHEVRIPKSVTYVGKDAFTELHTLEIEGDLKNNIEGFKISHLEEIIVHTESMYERITYILGGVNIKITLISDNKG